MFIVFIWLHQGLVAACGIFSCGMQTLGCGMWNLAPCLWITHRHLCWEHGVLVTGPPGKSWCLSFRTSLFSLSIMSSRFIHIVATVLSPLHACVLSHVSCVRLFATLWTVATRLLCPWDSSRQEYWSGLPLNLCLLVSFTTSATWEALFPFKTE